MSKARTTEGIVSYDKPLAMDLVRLCAGGDLERLKTLYTYQSVSLDLNVKDQQTQYTPICIAAKNGHAEVGLCHNLNCQMI